MADEILQSRTGNYWTPYFSAPSRRIKDTTCNRAGDFRRRFVAPAAAPGSYVMDNLLQDKNLVINTAVRIILDEASMHSTAR
jgi:hypothetical protein